MTLYLQLLFWFSIVGLAYIYVGYPVLIWALSRHGQAVAMQQYSVPVSVVIVVHNEEARIKQKLDNLLALDGADAIQEIFVGSDGSDDATNSVVMNYPDRRVRIAAFPTRRGKPAVLNELIPQCGGEVVILADARQEFDRAVLVRLVENFSDPKVGVVSGELVLRSGPEETTAARGIGLYWKYEKFIRKSESRFRGVPGATGACYAIRKKLFQPIKNQLILDDVAIPMQATQQGYRCLFESGAIAYDDPSQFPGQEAVRKRRTIAGAAQLVTAYPEWLSPFRNPLWFEFVSHKVLRLVSPLLLLTAFAANLALWRLPAYQVLFSLQIVMYLAAVVGWIFQKSNRKAGVFGVPLMFLALNVTTALALWDAARGKYKVTWNRAPDWDNPKPPDSSEKPQDE